MLLLIRKGGAHTVFLFFSFQKDFSRRSHLIGPPLIFLEHGALTYIEAWKRRHFPPQIWSMVSCASLAQFTSNIHGSWTMAEQSVIQKWGAIRNLLGNTLGTNKKPSLPLANPKEKNQAPLSLLIGCMKFVFHKLLLGPLCGGMRWALTHKNFVGFQ